MKATALQSRGWPVRAFALWLTLPCSIGAATAAELSPPPILKLHEGTARETKYLGVVLVTDARGVNEHGGPEAAGHRATEVVRLANELLERAHLRPRLRLVLVDHVSFEVDPFEPGTGDAGLTSEALLTAFNGWASIADLPTHDVHVLVTGRDLGSSDVGAAALGAACMQGFNGLVLQDRPTMASRPEQVFVHEVGHLLGMRHDGVDNACAAAGFLMSAVAQPDGLSTPRFSDCSLAEYSEFLAHPSSTCLTDIPIAKIAICGDGVRSGEEACDCGETETCADIDPCCTPRCTLAGSAICSSFNNPASCCSEQCDVAPADTVCRPARDSCDVAEVCTGHSARCPGDGWIPSGNVCVNEADGESGACFRGRCVTRTEQCSVVGAEIGIELTTPRAECLNEASPCAEATCWYSAPGVCFPLGRATAEGVPCGGGSQCVGGACVPSSTIDECPNHAKTEPGYCGCDVPDADEDSDGVFSCVDDCPTDPNKVSSAPCGCGLLEVNGMCSAPDPLHPAREDEVQATETEASPSCGCRLGRAPASGWPAFSALVAGVAAALARRSCRSRPSPQNRT